jgi:hypothetical protein
MKKPYIKWLAGQLMLSCSHSATLNPWLLAPLRLPSGIWTFTNRHGNLVTLQT